MSDRAYIAIDIETTGTDPETCQILEIGAVIVDPELKVMSCPVFNEIVDPIKDDGMLHGSSYALAMNQHLLDHIATNNCLSVDQGVDRMMDWVAHWQEVMGVDEFHPLGKNVGSFDIPFLKRVPSWRQDFFHYRCLEVGSMYATPEGIDGQAELIKQIELAYDIPGDEHTAVHDARVSLALARWKWSND